MSESFILKTFLTSLIIMNFAFISITETHGNDRPGWDTQPVKVKQYELERNDLLASEAGREFLSYLIDCALPEDTGVFFEHDGRRYEYRGVMGLAPGWLDSPLTESEERWVSACILARTNYFGIKVRVSMQAKHSDFQSLQVSEEERDQFTIYEGDFWGNLFVNDPVAFVYRGNRTPEEEQDPVLQKRVCTTLDERLSTSEVQLSRCGFVLSNHWSDSEPDSKYSKKYHQHVSVYLKPEKNN